MVSQDPKPPQLLNKFVYLVLDSQIFPIQKTHFTIGRKIDNDLVINNNFISRNHAQIRYEDGEFYLYDLKSTCGTFLNEIRAVRSILYSGDTIKVANTLLTFIYEGGPLERGLDDTTSNLKEKKKEIEQRTAVNRDRSLETKISVPQKEVTDKQLTDQRPAEQKPPPPQPEIQHPAPVAADINLTDQKPAEQKPPPTQPQIQHPKPVAADINLTDQKPAENLEKFLNKILGDSEPGNEAEIDRSPAELSEPPSHQPQIQYPKPESRDTEVSDPKTPPPIEPSIEKNIEESKPEVGTEDSIDQKAEKKGARFLNRLFGFSKSESKKKEIPDQEAAPKTEHPPKPQIEIPKAESREKEKVELRPGRKLEPAPAQKVELIEDERRNISSPQKPQDAESQVYLIINQQLFHITKDVTTIGRELDNDVVLHDNFISRNHAEIRFEDGKYTLYDQDSTSGSFINNKKVEQGVLYSGDLVLIANIPMIFINERGGMESASEDITGKLSP